MILQSKPLVTNFSLDRPFIVDGSDVIPEICLNINSRVLIIGTNLRAYSYEPSWPDYSPK